MRAVHNLILAAILSFGTSVTAQAESRFVKFSTLSQKAKKAYSQADKAQFKIRVSSGARCTGTFISNNGHGLTAAHCVQKCMPFPGVEGLRHWPVDVIVKGKKSKHKVTANRWAYPQVCEAVIDGQSFQIELLAGPKGRHAEALPVDMASYFRQYFLIVQSEVDAYKKNWLSSFYDGWGMGGDFAVFKIKGETPQRTDCLKISEKDSFGGEHYSLSYPGKTSVGAKEVNHDLYLSSGEVFQGKYFNSGLIEIEDQNHKYLNSNLLAFPGSSGASLVKSKTNEISGVLSLVVGREGMTRDGLPTARFVSSKVIREQAGEILNQISCKSNSL